MPRHVKYGLRDGNQAELDDAARRLGWHVLDTSQFAAYEPGFPDAVWVNNHGLVVLIEYKIPGEKLTDVEQAFADEWHANGGAYSICVDLDDVLEITEDHWPGRVG